ncbi:hypothetical protein [Yeguia hominis]|uniref:Uncharacterized protein n=1 Tax=Yeguia hominis TaxID=2763662 RepID=A0A926HQ93_9FIRM|nr:hypothetical protein [Yeguia hominis]MBC8532489.1 hypothetical protein [Yeguia hominis]
MAGASRVLAEMAGKSPQKILWQIPQLAQFCPPDPISAFVNQRQDKQIENGPQSGSLSGFEDHFLFAWVLVCRFLKSGYCFGKTEPEYKKNREIRTLQKMKP